LQRLFRLDLEESEIGHRVATDDLRLEDRIVGQNDVDLLGARDDMIVGHDQAGGIDDEAGAEGVNRRTRRA